MKQKCKEFREFLGFCFIYVGIIIEFQQPSSCGIADPYPVVYMSADVQTPEARRASVALVRRVLRAGAYRKHRSQSACGHFCRLLSVDEFHRNSSGAGDGNRTHTTSLEGWNSTIELHPHIITI